MCWHLCVLFKIEACLIHCNKVKILWAPNKLNNCFNYFWAESFFKHGILAAKKQSVPLNFNTSLL